MQNKKGAKPKYKNKIIGIFIRCSEADKEQIKKLEKKLLKKNLK